MRNLLAANFARLWRDKLFWIGMAVMAGLQAFELSMLYVEHLQYGVENHLENVLYVYGVFGPIVMSVFLSMFLGTEYSDGTLRNKLIVGQRRSHIYLANLMVCGAAGLLFSLANLLVSLALGIPMFGLRVPVLSVVTHTLCTFFMILAFAAIFTLIGMLCHSKAFTVAVSILLVFGFFMVGLVVKQCLMAPEMESHYEMSVDGEFVETDPQPNPKYLRGTKRKFYEFLDQFLPGGQILANSRMMEESDNDRTLVLYDVVWVVLTAGGGILLFQRKDLK